MTDPELNERSSDVSGKSRLKLKQEFYSLTDEGRRCEACGRMLPSDAVLCVDCGQLTDGTGRVALAGVRPAKRRLLVLTVLLIATMGFAAFKSNLPELFSKEIAEVRGRFIDTQQAAVSQGLSELRARLDRDYPMLKVSDFAEVRQQNGLVVRGRILQMDDHQIEIDTDAGPQNLSLASLDLASRILLDSAERELLINQMVQANDASTLETAMSVLSGLSKGEESDSMPAVTEEHVDESSTTSLETFAAMLDASHPRYQLDEQVVIVQRNGLVRRGKFKGVDGNAALLDVDGSAHVRILFSQIRGSDLIRISERHRGEAARKMANK